MFNNQHLCRTTIILTIILSKKKKEKKMQRNSSKRKEKSVRFQVGRFSLNRLDKFSRVKLNVPPTIRIES